MDIVDPVSVDVGTPLLDETADFSLAFTESGFDEQINHTDALAYLSR